MPYYLGIDGGGTKTTCALGDESEIFAIATAGPSNIVRVGEERALQSLHEGVRQVCAAAGIVPAQIVRTCVGGSGAGRPEIANRVRGMLAEILTTPILVVGDMEITLAAAFDRAPGVIVIAGTGSMAYGRNADGQSARAGGWGFAIGDEGSAHWIGRSAVSAVLRAVDESPDGRSGATQSMLAEALCKAWQVGSLLELARLANSNPPPDFAALFPAVATSTDQLARELQTQAGGELARIAAIVMSRLFAEHDQTMVQVAMTGSVFRHGQLTREAFYNELRRRDARAEIIPTIVEPVEGALRMARRTAAES